MRPMQLHRDAAKERRKAPRRTAVPPAGPARVLKLTKDWGKHKAGSLLTIIEPGHTAREHVIDAKRAAKLVADGRAIVNQPTAAAPPAIPPPAGAQSGTPQGGR